MRGRATRVIEIYSGKMVVADPCFDQDCRGYYCHGAKKGDWMVYIDYDEETGTPSFLGAVHLDFENDYTDLPWFDIEDVLGVDTGRMSIYDKAEYDYAHQESYHETGTLEPPYFYADNFGIISRTRYGDGVCYAMAFTEDEDKSSPIVAIEIDLC